jgi:hypothetical protein
MMCQLRYQLSVAGNRKRQLAQKGKSEIPDSETDPLEPVMAKGRVNSETLSQACLPQCSRNTRSRSRSSTASRLVLTECSETSSRCESKWKRGSEVKLTDVTAKVVIYEEFIEVKIEAPKHRARGPTVVQ